MYSSLLLAAFPQPLPVRSSTHRRAIINNNMQYRGFLCGDRRYGRSDGNQSRAGHGGGCYDGVMNIEWREQSGGREGVMEEDGEKGMREEYRREAEKDDGVDVARGGLRRGYY